MNKATKAQCKIWLAELERILAVWERRLQGGKVNLMGLFQDVWKSAGRTKSWVVSRMRISVDMCSVSHDTQRGVTATHSLDIKEKVLGEGIWRWRRWAFISSWAQYNPQCNAIYIYINSNGLGVALCRFASTESCSWRRNYSGNYFRWFRSVCCTPLICLWLYWCLVKQPSLWGMEHLHFTAVLSLMGQRKQKPAINILSSSIPVAPKVKIRTPTPYTPR